MSATACNGGQATIPGWFWIPGGDDERVAGQLVLANGRIEIKLVGALTPTFKTTRVESSGGTVVKHELNEVGVTADHFVVHGILMQSPGKVTLVDCMTIDRRHTIFGDLVEGQHLRAMYMFGGGHLSGLDEEFVGLRVRLRNLETWASVGDVTFGMNSEDHGMTVSCRPLKLAAAPLANGSKIDIWSEVSAPRSDTFHRRSLRHKVMFEVMDIPNLSWRELGRQLVTPLVSLVTLCVGEYCLPTEYRALTQGGDWVDVIYGSEGVDEPGQPLHKMLVPLSDLTLPQVATWLNIVERLGPLPPVVAKSFTASSLNVETELLNLTTVAEGLHSRIFADRERISGSEASRLRALVKGALADESSQYRDLILGSLRHLTEPSYKARLVDLVDEAARGMPNLVGNTLRWARDVGECRNDYAHRRAGFLGKQEIDKYVGIILSLRWVLAGVLLLQTGIAPDVLAARIAQDQSYQFFLGQMQEYLPDAYPLDEANIE